MAEAVARMRCACAAARWRTSAKSSLLERQNLLLGVEHLALVVLQLRRGEALGVDQRLLAFVIGGREVQIGVGDFDVVAEDVIEADLERLDAGALPLARFDLRDVLAAVLAEIAQLVELGIESRRGWCRRRSRLSGGSSEMASRMASATSGSSSRRSCSARSRAACCVSKQRFSAGIFSSERPSASRSRGPADAERDLGEQPLQIENAAQLLAQFGAQDGLLQQIRPRRRGAARSRRDRARDAAAAGAAGGRPCRLRSGRARRAGWPAFGRRVGGEERLDQFQVAHGDGVEHHGFGAVVVGGAVEMVERGALGVAQVVQDGAGGADGRGPVGQSAAIEREQLEMVAQGAVGVVVGEDPVFEFGAHEARRAVVVAGEQRQIGRGTALRARPAVRARRGLRRARVR